MTESSDDCKQHPYVPPKEFTQGAIAIQALVRQLEVNALSDYATNPGGFESLVTQIGDLVEKLRPHGEAGAYCKRPCPPGYYCCCGSCLPYGYNCHLCEGKFRSKCSGIDSGW